MNFLSKLDFYYNIYPHLSLVKNKIEFIKKFKEIETTLIFSKDILSLDEIIFRQLDFTTSFANYRYIYIISKLDISNNLQKNLIEYIFKFFNKLCYSTTYYPHIHYLIKLLISFSPNNIEDRILAFKNKPIFKNYLKEFIILLGTIGGRDSFNFLFYLLKSEYNYRDYCFLSIGKIVSYQRYPVIKRVFLKEYLNFIYKILHSNIETSHSKYLYYSLIEIFLLPNGIDGRFQNKLSEIIYLQKEKNIYKNITLKVINNSLLNNNEKNLIKLCFASS